MKAWDYLHQPFRTHGAFSDRVEAGLTEITASMSMGSSFSSCLRHTALATMSVVTSRETL
jgi:hypothetical protein